MGNQKISPVAIVVAAIILLVVVFGLYQRNFGGSSTLVDKAEIPVAPGEGDAALSSKGGPSPTGESTGESTK